MPNITLCPKCGNLYESASEELANEPLGMGNPYARYCRICFLMAIERARTAEDHGEKISE